VASSAASGAQSGHQSGAPAPLGMPEPAAPNETPWLCPPTQIQREPDVTPDSNGLRVLTLTAAIGLAAVAAYFSITGMTILFPGAVLAMVAMTATMEAGKHHWSATSVLLRTVLVAVIATLALVNAVGAMAD
jgi:hypothetical protein